VKIRLAGLVDDADSVIESEITDGSVLQRSGNAIVGVNPNTLYTTPLYDDGGLESDGGEIRLSGAADLSIVTDDGVFEFAGTDTGNGVECAYAFVGNDGTTSDTAIFAQVDNQATPAISQDADGLTIIQSASGETIHIITSGSAGIHIGQTASPISPTGVGSVVIGGKDGTGVITASGAYSLVIGAAVSTGELIADGVYAAYVRGLALAGGVIQSSGYGSSASGYAILGTSSITASGAGSDCGGVAGSTAPSTMVTSGAGSFARGAGHSVAGDYGAAVGLSNTISAAGDSGFAAGSGNSVTADSAAAIGKEASARLPGAVAEASGSNAAPGDAQGLRVSLLASTTDATPTEMLIDGSDRIAILANSTVVFKITVVAQEQAGGTERAAYTLKGAIYRDVTAASTTIGGSVDKTVVFETTAGFDVSATADTTNGALKIEVTGLAATDVYWVARVELSELVAPA
jgi:hypothetical protein